jgi:hypothetical protein
MPQNAQAPLTLGFLSYAAGDKTAALEAFKKAQELDTANFKRRFDQSAQRATFKAILEDQDFLKRLFP